MLQRERRVKAGPLEIFVSEEIFEIVVPYHYFLLVRII
jgi:hypothetical protein